MSLMAVSERLDSEDGHDHREFVWISFSANLYICWTAVFDRCQLYNIWINYYFILITYVILRFDFVF